MGFPSPATDYIEQRLTPETICGVGIDTRILETLSGYAVVEPVSRLERGQVLLILSGGRTQLAKLMGRALICDDGEAIEDSAMDETEILGRVTYFINRMSGTGDESPV